MILFSVLIAPAVMAAASLIERRLGPSAAGWVGALPIAFGVAVVAVAVDSSPATAAAMALSAGVHVPAQVIFGLVFAHVLHCHGLLRGVICGALAYLAGALLLERLPAVLAVSIAVVVLLAVPRLMPSAPLRPASARRWPVTALTCVGAAVIVAAAVTSSRLSGPGLAGAVAAFPTMCTMLTVVAATRDGATAGVQTLVGLVRSLPCYLAFCVTVAFTAPVAGIACIGLGLMACLAAASLAWRRVPVTRTPALGHEKILEPVA